MGSGGRERGVLHAPRPAMPHDCSPCAAGTHRRPPAPPPQSELAKFMGTEEAILYSYDLVTMSSILPAFANARDLVVCDEVGGSGQGRAARSAPLRVWERG